MGKVAKKSETNVVEFDISMMEADASVGVSNMGQDDLALPFLKILSGLDPLLDELDEAKRGDLYNTVSGQIYKGKEGVMLIPCAYQRRFIQWAPRGVGSGAPTAIYEPNDARPKVERSKDDNKDYVADGSGEYIEETHQHFVILLAEDGSMETALIAMKSTQLKKSRKWNSMIQSTTMVGKNGPFQAPRFSHVYLLKTISEENSKGAWHGWEMSIDGPVTDVKIYNRGKAFAESISAGDVVVKHTEDDSSSVKESDSDPVTEDKEDEIPF
jgi:hypothetical protein